MTNKVIVTAQDIVNNEHIFIKCSNTVEALRAAGQLHILGEHRYRQVRLRSVPCPKKLYKDMTAYFLVGA